MISGDSTANHMGTVKNLEKARERRTLETMPGSSEAGVPEDLLQQTETIHPRMGYDMSDSIFMQEQQAADRSKEAKKAVEERTALEAFRAATLHAQAKPISVGLSHPSAKDPGPVLAEGKRRPESVPQMLPIAGIKLRKKNSSSGRAGGEGSGRAGGPGAKGRVQGSAMSGADAAAGSSTSLIAQDGLVRDISASAAGGKKRSSSKKSKTKHARADDAGDGDVAGAGASTAGVATSSAREDPKARANGNDVDGAGKPGEDMSGGDASGGGGKAAAGALGLVAYSSDEDDHGDNEST